MLDTKNQFGVGRICQSKRKVEAQIKKNLGAALMDDLMFSFLTYGIRYGAQSEHKARRDSDSIEHRDTLVSKRDTAPQFCRVHYVVRIDDSVAANLVVTEPIGKSNFGANKDPAVKLKKVPLIGSTQDVVVVKFLLWCTSAVYERTPEISGVCTPAKSEH